MKIDKNIPLPENTNPPGHWQKLFSKMEIGDSVFFEYEQDLRKFSSSTWRDHGRGCLRRQRLENGWRVWRVA